jgi:hypothetical protein
VNTDQFADSIWRVVYRDAADDVLGLITNPPGRRPSADLVALSAWANGLSETDRERLTQVIRLAADYSIFGVMAVLDGVRTADDKHTEFYLRTGDGTLLNEHRDLHEAFRATVDKRR